MLYNKYNAIHANNANSCFLLYDVNKGYLPINRIPIHGTRKKDYQLSKRED
jgi:hypothetical protein